MGNQNADVGFLAVGDPVLGAVQYVAVTVADRRAAHAGGVGAGAGLRQREAAENLAFCQGFEELALLLVVAELANGVADKRVVHRHDDAGGRAARGDFFHGDGIAQVVQAGAAPFLIDGDAQKAQLCQLFDLLGRKLAGLVGLVGNRRQLVFGEPPRGVQNHLLRFIEREVHGNPGRQSVPQRAGFYTQSSDLATHRRVRGRVSGARGLARALAHG